MAKKIGTAGRSHKMGTGVSVDSIEVVPNGHGMRQIMRGHGAQEAVGRHAQRICESANTMSAGSITGAQYVVHPRVLTVSAHAFIDPANYQARLAQHHHQTLEKAFWENQGR